MSSGCIYCGSLEHASKDCPHGAFSSKKCIYCGSVNHASEDCPHGIFSGRKCTYCGSLEHASNDCPHGTFSAKKCVYCGSVNHASEDCPHGTFSARKCIYCGSLEHASLNCPHKEDFFPQLIAKLAVIGGIIFLVVWLAVNVVLPILLLNSALIFTLTVFAFWNQKNTFSILALVGGVYMLLDIYNGWLSANFVNNVVKNPTWVTVFVYINALAMGLSMWFLMTDTWFQGVDLSVSNKRKSILLKSATISSIILGTLAPPLIYHSFNNPFSTKVVTSNSGQPLSSNSNEMATPITPAAIEEGSTPLLASKIAAQKNLNVRSTPSVDGAKLELIPQFDQVTLVERGPKDFVDGKEDYWYKVEYNGNYGYVFGHYTNFKLEGLRTITLPFMDCSMGDLYHIVFGTGDPGDPGYFDFGDGNNDLSGYDLCVEDPEGNTTGNPQYIGKQFKITYNDLLAKVYCDFPDEMPNCIRPVKTIVSLELITQE